MADRAPAATYAVAIRFTTEPEADGGQLAAAVDLRADWPPLVDEKAALADLPEALARRLGIRAADYASVADRLVRGSVAAAAGTFRTVEGAGRVTVLEAPWHGMSAGSLAYVIGLEDGRELCFVRDDVVVDPATGDVVHVDAARSDQAPARGGLMLASGAGNTYADSILTLGEYASFMVPVAGPLVAGVVHIFRSLFFGGGGNRPKPKPSLSPAELLARAAALYVSGRVEEFQAIVRDSYERYRIADNQVDDTDKPSAIVNLHRTVDDILNQDSHLSALAILDGDDAYKRRGAMAWAFAKQFHLLLLRKASVLDGWSYQQPDWTDKSHKDVSDSLRWAFLANELLSTLPTLAKYVEMLHADAAELQVHLDAISGRKDGMVWESVSGYGQIAGRWEKEYYYFEDGTRPGERLGMAYISKKNSDDHAQNQTDNARREYVSNVSRGFYGSRYGYSDVQQVASLRDTILRMLWSVIENLELFIVPCSIGWEGGDDLQALETWRGDSAAGQLKFALSAGTAQWPFASKFSATAPEVTSGYLDAQTPVAGMVRAGQGISIMLPQDTAAGEWAKVYAVQVRCWVPSETTNPCDARGRRLLIRWTDLAADDDSSQSLLVPPTEHVAGDQTWVTRTVTVPLKCAGKLESITVEGHGDYWAPDIIEVKVAKLKDFPKF